MKHEHDLDAMRQRLKQALKEKGITYAQAAANAKVGNSYVSGIINEGKDPQFSFLARVCEGNGIGLYWLLYGVEIKPETERLLKIIEENPEKRDSILSLLAAEVDLP